MTYIAPIGKNTINLVFATDSNHVSYFSVALASIFFNSTSKHTYDIVVLDDDVSDKDKQIILKQIEKYPNFSIRWFNMKKQISSIPKEQLNCDEDLIKSAYFGLWIPNLFQKYRKVLYLDCNIVLLDDVASLFLKDIGKNWLAASLDALKYKSHSSEVMQLMDYIQNILGMKDVHNYLSDGVLLYDIPQMRKNKIQEKSFLLWKNLKKPFKSIQDILSLLCEGHVYNLESIWNFPYDLITPQNYNKHLRHMPKKVFENLEDVVPNLKLIHFDALRTPQDYPFRKLSWYFWYYAYFSPYYKKIIDAALPNRCGIEDANFQNTPKISVIIPVYNREGCIIETLDSVLSQTLKEIEVICIDDGSTDGTYQCIYNYALKHKQIRLLHFSNHGAAISRNIGIKEARGEYIAFMDSDDYYPQKDTLEHMYVAAKNSNSLICGGRVLTSLNGQKTLRHEQVEKFFTNKKVYYTEYVSPYGFWRFIYSRSLLLENHLEFPNLWRYEDPPFMVRAFYAAKYFFALSEPTYVYVKHTHPVDFSNARASDVLDGIISVLDFSREKHKVLHRNLYRGLIKYAQDLPLIYFARPLKEFYPKIKELIAALDKNTFIEPEYPKTPLELIKTILNLANEDSKAQLHSRRQKATFIIKKKYRKFLSYWKKLSIKCDKEINVIRVLDKRKNPTALPVLFRKIRKFFPYSYVEYVIDDSRNIEDILKSAKKYEIILKVEK